MDFTPYIQRYENELINEVIPFWEDHCVDHEFGGYFTSLDRDGSVYDTEKYMWMQWRIVYMFATFYMSSYRKEKWLEIAKQGFDFLTKYGKSEDGTYYFALNRKGEPTMAPSNIFSDCFAATSLPTVSDRKTAYLLPRMHAYPASRRGQRLYTDGRRRGRNTTEGRGGRNGKAKRHAA